MTNRKEAGRCVRRFLLILFAFILGTLSVPATVLAEETLQIPVRFADPGNPEILEWEFPYSDEWFLASDELFNRELAKGSMGLAVSAFMPDEETGPEPQVETYLSGAGFEMIWTFGYDQPIGTDTLAGIIGRKSFDGFTLFAEEVERKMKAQDVFRTADEKKRKRYDLFIKVYSVGLASIVQWLFNEINEFDADVFRTMIEQLRHQGYYSILNDDRNQSTGKDEMS